MEKNNNFAVTLSPKESDSKINFFINSMNCRNKNKLPPTSVVLPLLTGLAKRTNHPKTMNTLVDDALIKFQARQRIGTWLMSCIYKKKSKKEKLGDSTSLSLLSYDHVHWLFESLKSPSIRVRRAAARILLDGTDSKSRPLLKDALLSMIQKDLDSFHDGRHDPFLHHHNSISHNHYNFHPYALSGISNSSIDGDYMIQCFGILHHIICDDDTSRNSGNTSNVLLLDTKEQPQQESHVTTDGKKKSTKVMVSHSHCSTEMMMESFLAEGGLRWATRQIVALVTLLLRDSIRLNITSSSTQQTHGWTALAQEDFYTDAIQTRILLLVDLCHSLLLSSSILPCSTKKTDMTSLSSNKNTVADSIRTTKPKHNDNNNNTKHVDIMDNDKKKGERLATLNRAQALLWNSKQTLAATSVIHTGNHEEDFSYSNYNSNDQKLCQSSLKTTMNQSSVALSPLACLIIAHEVLKSGMTKTSPSTRNSDSSIQNNSTGSISSTLTADSLDNSDYPLRCRLNGSMDKCALLLSKLVNPTSQPIVTVETLNNNKKNSINNTTNGKRSDSNKRNRSNNSINHNTSKRVLSSLLMDSSKQKRQRKRQRLFFSSRRQQKQQQLQQQQQQSTSSTDSISNYLFGRDAAIRLSNNNLRGSSFNGRTMVADALHNVLNQHGITSTNLHQSNDNDDDGDDIIMEEPNVEEPIDDELEDDVIIDDEDLIGEDGEVDESAVGQKRYNDHKHCNNDEEEEEEDENIEVNDEEDDNEEDEEEDEENMMCEDEDNGLALAPEDDEEIDSDEGEDQVLHLTSDHFEDAMDSMNNNIEVQDVVMAEEEEDEEEEEDDDDGDNDDQEEEEEDHVLGAPVVGQFDDAILVVDEEVGSDDPDDHVHIHTSNDERGVLGGNNQQRNASNPKYEGKDNTLTVTSQEALDDKKNTYISACMEVLQAQHPALHLNASNNILSGNSKNVENISHFPASSLDKNKRRVLIPTQRNNQSYKPMAREADSFFVAPPLLTTPAEQSLIRSICNVVKPPKKPLNLKIFLRRAPTQEEFFRGSLSRNPVSLSSLKAAPTNNSGSTDEDNSEPCVRDLRQQIANDLQMADSAELLELLVANKILDMDLKLRVVFQQVWRKHLMENATTTPSGSNLHANMLSGQHVISAGSGLSMIFSTIGDRGTNTRSNLNENTPLCSLPPMIITYRLAGVDGEATEDKVEVSDLVDPDAPPDTSTSSVEYEERMEKEYGITRTVADSRGINVLLRSAESYLNDVLRRIRRDDVGRIRGQGKAIAIKKNHTRDAFLKSAPCPALILLRHCTIITDNRKKMVKARAPTILLRMLLDVLNCIDDPCQLKSNSKTTSSLGVETSNTQVQVDGTETNNQQTQQPKTHSPIGNNPTADALQDLIETLASDISASSTKCKKVQKTPDNSELSSDLFHDEKEESDKTEHGESILPMLLSSLRSTSLSPPLRKVIAKLLPFLTYGQLEQSRALASDFIRHISVEALINLELGKTTNDSLNENKSHVLVETFVDTAINLPPDSVCHTLRMELINQGFLQTMRSFLLSNAPKEPPCWSPALASKSLIGNDAKSKEQKNANLKSWRKYYESHGLQSAFRILIGLSAYHSPTQCFLGDIEGLGLQDAEKNNDTPGFMTFAHWIESTSDNTTANIDTKDLGLLAETLLDSLTENNSKVRGKVASLRKKTRDRKKEIAEERRNRALVGMSSFGPLTGVTSSGGIFSGKNPTSSNRRNVSMLGLGIEASTQSVRATRASSLVQEGSVSISNPIIKKRSSSQVSTVNGISTSSDTDKKVEETKPAWMLEMEAMEDEDGLTCAICHEGRTLQPSELLGLYAYVKKVSVPFHRGGGRGIVDGSVLLLSLPQSLPGSLADTRVDGDWFQSAKTAAVAIQNLPNSIAAMSYASSASNSTSSSGRPCNFIITVTAGNAIHCTCHSRARTADRNHPKAPKSEWEGASLRNSRATCNVIFPLVSTQSSKVPLMAVENALGDYQTVVANTLGSRPKSMLWTVLHDVRFLLLRMSYGEALSDDCGGGSLSSNLLLLFYSLQMADMFSDDAEHDAPETAQHARELSTGFLIASELLRAEDYSKDSPSAKRLQKSFADAAPMAAICCILFSNTVSVDVNHRNKTPTGNDTVAPHPKRRWEIYKSHFLCGLLRCAGRRFATGLDGSGCESNRGSVSGRRKRTGSFSNWEVSETDRNLTKSSCKVSSRLGKQSKKAIDDYEKGLRPFLTLFALLDQLSAEFTLSMDDLMVEESCARVLKRLESCLQSGNIQHLIRQAKITLDQEKIIEEFEYGVQSV